MLFGFVCIVYVVCLLRALIASVWCCLDCVGVVLLCFWNASICCVACAFVFVLFGLCLFVFACFLSLKMFCRGCVFAVVFACCACVCVWGCGSFSMSWRVIVVVALCVFFGGGVRLLLGFFEFVFVVCFWLVKVCVMPIALFFCMCVLVFCIGGDSSPACSS